jgi:hypothetical protein
MIDRVAEGIKTKFTGSALAGNVTGIYFNDVPPQTDLPYVVFFDISNLNDDTFGRDGEFYRIQFSVFVQERSIVADNGMKEIYEDLRSLYDQATLTMTGWTNYMCRFLAMHNMPTISGVLHRVVDYEVRTQKT